MSISIIIPVLNEERAIGSCLDSLVKEPDLEILVVDGGSHDRTIDEITARGLTPVVSAPGRGIQLHAGAKGASGDILLFLHCDTGLPNDFASHIQKVLQRDGVVAGAFQLRINAKGWGLRVVESGANLRSRFLGLPYGDQALFVKRDVYFKTKGFPEQPILEELLFLSRLKKTGRIAIAPAWATTSARRWQQNGIVKTTVVNQLMLAGWALGIAPERLGRWYYRHRK